MQIKDNYLIQKSLLWIVIRALIALLALYFVYLRFQSKELEISIISWPNSTIQILCVVILLMFLNWSLEAVRWKISVEVFEKISFKECVKIVLGGLALNWVLPFTSGDALYRLLPIKDKYKSASALVINRVLMLSITMLFGLVSIQFYSKNLLHIDFSFLLFLLILIPVYWLIKKNIERFISYFKLISVAEFLQIVLISLLRYSVFTLQFYLLLALFLPEVEAKVLILGIGWIFFFRSLIPSILGGLGIREASGLIFFEAFDPTLVIAPIFIIWIINSVIPSFLGLAFFLVGKRRMQSMN